MYYYGWVPTIIGRLTFAFVGSTIDRRNGRQWGGPLTKLFDNAHAIVFFQDLRTGDAALLFPFTDERQVNRIVVVGKRAAGEASGEPFQGRMFVVSSSVWPKLPDYSELDVVSREMQRLADASVEFILQRDGIVVFDEPVFKPSGKLDEAEERYIVADRMYALLKDFCHIHQHHSSEADEMIRLKRVDNPESFLWARDILLEMYGHIVGMKRDPGTPAYQYTDALGVLAYAQSFRKIVENRWKRMCPEMPVPFFDLHDDELRSSLNAARDGEQMRYERGQALAVQFVALLIAITAVFLSFLQTIGQFKPSELRTDTVAEWTITHITKHLTLYGGMLFPILVFSSFVWVFIWHKRQAYVILYGIYRLLLSTPRRINAGFWFAVAVILFLGSLFAALLLLARG